MVKKIIKREDVEQHLPESEYTEPAATPLSAPNLGGVVHRRVQEAQAQAEAMLAAARAEAAHIVAEAQQLRARVADECAAARDEAAAEGRAEGQASCSEFAARLLARKEAFFATIESDLLRLIQQTVEKITGQLTADSQTVLQSIVRQAIDAAIGERVMVRVHPDDYARLQTAEQALKIGIDKAKRIQLRADDHVVPGGCIVETEVGTIDAQLATQLTAIYRGLGLPEPELADLGSTAV